MLVERIFLSSGGVVRDDRDGALGGDRLAEAVAVIGSIRHEDLGGQVFDQGVGLRGITLLAGREDKPYRAAEAAHSEMDLGAQATAGPAKGLIFRPPFLAPTEC